MRAFEQEQRDHFDDPRHQYRQASIIRPPVHTMLEVSRAVAAVGAPEPDRAVIDFGAGTGRLSIALARGGHRVHAVDVSASSLATLNETLGILGLPGVTTSECLPVDGRFQAVVGADILHHVDLDTYLPLMRAVLDDDGVLVFSEPGGMNPFWYALFTLSGDMRVERRIVRCTLWSLRRALRRHGFRDVRITGVGLLPRPFFGLTSGLCRWHDQLGNAPILRWFAYRYLVEARVDCASTPPRKARMTESTTNR